MIRLLWILLVIHYMVIPANAMEFTAPPVPESGIAYMPSQTDSLGNGLWSIVKYAITQLHPEIAEAASICLSVVAVVLLAALLKDIQGNTEQITELAAAIVIGILFLKPAHSLIALGIETIRTMYDYGKLLLPVMTSALAAQGGITSSAALFAGTSLFSAVLVGLINQFLVPLLYVYMVMSIANCALKENMIQKLRDFVKWILTWSLKIILYVFTGYMTITGVITGTADASAIRAAKLTISGVVPMVGSILSDASETILISASMMKNSVGLYGILALLAVCIGPFIHIGCQYLMTKITGAVCSVLGAGKSSSLVEDISKAMGMLLAMTGTVCFLLLIGTVCFMRGVT